MIAEFSEFLKWSDVQIMTKKFFGIAIAFVTVFLMALSVSAYTVTASTNREKIKNYDEVFSFIYDSVLRGESEIDLSEFKIKDTDIFKIYTDIILSSPEFFYLNNSMEYYYNRQNIVTSISLSYNMSSGQIASAYLNYEEEITYIASLVDEDLSDAEKALFVHDYLISSFRYDETFSKFDVYSFLKKRVGVCQSYALAYVAVLRELGMDSVVVSSSEMNHAWNLVKIDGAWYHVDLAFDDPTPDLPGRVLHENFLLSDDQIKKTKQPHYGWESTIKCSSNKYEKALWSGVESRMVYLDDQWFFIKKSDNALAVSRFNGNYQYIVYSIGDKWYADGDRQKYWAGCFSGVSEFLGYIFINTPNQIIIYDPSNGKASIFYEYSGSKMIVGSTVFKNNLEYIISPSPNDLSHSEKVIFEIADFSIDNKIKSMPFVDVNRLDYFYNSVRFVCNKGWFKGVSSTRFAPNASLTRAMFVTVLGRLCNVDTTQFKGKLYRDVEDGLWYSAYINWSSLYGIVNGMGDGRFSPNGELNHEQMYKIIAKCGMLLGLGKTDLSDVTVTFEDKSDISWWAKESVEYCMANSLIDDIYLTELKPKDKATRADAAQILYKFAKMCGVS